MQKPKMYRKRYEPLELVDITNDELIFRNENLIVTAWEPIKKRNDILYGISFTFIKEGYKVSEIYDLFQNFRHWYCDIIDVQYDKEMDSYTFVDLLVDIVISPSRCYEILDLDELSDLYEGDKISKDEIIKALRNLNNLINSIKKDKFLPDNYLELKAKAKSKLHLK